MDELERLQGLLAAEDSGDEQCQSAVHNGDTDSSEDEDNRNRFEKRYDDYGLSVKKALDSVEAPPKGAPPKEAAKSWKTKGEGAAAEFELALGLRVARPLVSSQTLAERMKGRRLVALDSIRCIDSGEDWVFSGVVVRKSATRQSGKGASYCIWTLSDLRPELKTVSLFLFRDAHKRLWKLPEGTAVGVLNPNVLDKRDDSKDEACLSVDNADRVMVLGHSKDLGRCRGRKKDGDPCTAFVNANACEYCVYHVQREYKKCSRRSELQASFSGGDPNRLRNKVLGKDSVMYGGKMYQSVPAKKSARLTKEDDKRLSLLNGTTKSTPVTKPVVDKKRRALSQVESNKAQRLKDLKRLEALSGPSVSPVGSLQLKRDTTVDLCKSYSAKQKELAKLNALRYVSRHGPLLKNDPNSVKKSAENKKPLTKRSLDDADENEPKKTKTTGVSSEKFQKMLMASSAHSDLVTQHDDAEQEKYFKKLESKEKMEEKMLSTFKVACKAVRCLKCDYKSFSASDRCKAEGHPLKVFDTFKRFFKCDNCSNRTVSLDIIPLQSCKNCHSSKWLKAPMMKEKKGLTIAETLSIRGEEETFLGTIATNTLNLNLLMPE